MVKVIGLTKEEVSRKERENKLAKIAQEKFPELKIVRTNNGGMGVYPKQIGSDSLFHVFLESNKLEVYNKTNFDSALALAKEYEKIGEPEFTIKKSYE